MNDLEQQLHDALDREARDVVVPTDGWQRNRQRLVNDRAARRDRRWRVAGVAAAVVALLAFLVPSVGPLRSTFDGADSSDGPPALSDEGQLGEKVTVAQVTKGGTTVPYEAYLTDRRGDVEFCEGYDLGSVRIGTCSTADDGTEGVKAGVLPYLVQRANDDGSQQGFAGAVAARVTRVQLWRVDGTSSSLPLEALGHDGLKAFGLYRASGQQPVQRLAFLSAKDAVLHTVDMTETSGIAQADGCQTMGPLQTVAGSTSMVAVGPAEAHVLPDGDPSRATCLALTRPLQGVRQDADTAILVLAPEVARVTLVGGSSSLEVNTQRSATDGTIWRVVTVPNGAPLSDDYRFAALDGAGAEIASLPVSSLQ